MTTILLGISIIILLIILILIIMIFNQLKNPSRRNRYGKGWGTSQNMETKLEKM